MVTYSELFAYSLVIIGVIGLVIAANNRPLAKLSRAVKITDTSD